MRGFGIAVLVVALLVVAANFSEVKAGAYASCAGAASVSSCGGSANAKIRRTPVRNFFAQLQERRAERVSARSASCSGSAATKIQVQVLSCPTCE